MTVSEGGDRIQMGRVHLTHVESGRTAISEERVRRLCAAYSCTSSPHVDALVSMCRDTGKGWWSSYRDRLAASALDLAELESRATSLLSFEALFIPGLFQLEEYTRAIFRASGAVSSPEEAEAAVRLRMNRQVILTDDRHRPTIHVVIHEAALRMRFGGPDVMRRQLLRLVQLADLPNVTIQVLPFTADGAAAVNAPFLFISSHGGALDTVLVEHPAASMFLHSSEEIDQYRSQFARLSAAALPPVDPRVTAISHDTRDSLAMIQHVLYTYMR